MYVDCRPAAEPLWPRSSWPVSLARKQAASGELAPLEKSKAAEAADGQECPICLDVRERGGNHFIFDASFRRVCPCVLSCHRHPRAESASGTLPRCLIHAHRQWWWGHGWCTCRRNCVGCLKRPSSRVRFGVARCRRRRTAFPRVLFVINFATHFIHGLVVTFRPSALLLDHGPPRSGKRRMVRCSL